MQCYRDFRPTGFDPKGLGLVDQQDWLVCPVARNRDSGVLAESNWEVFGCILDGLDPAGVDHETHRFGQWANGWFELVIVRPGSACAVEAESFEASLSDYPVLDDSDYSERELAAAESVWAHWPRGDAGRVAFMRANRRDFECPDFSSLLACARGRAFHGSCSAIVD
jgi:hypothetical protein